MSYERDEAMQAQEAMEHMISMRQPRLTVTGDLAAYDALMRSKEAWRAQAHRLTAELADSNRELEILRKAMRGDRPHEPADINLWIKLAAIDRWPMPTAEHRAMRAAFCDGASAVINIQSAPVGQAPHNTGERDPSVMPDYAGADTKPRCLVCDWPLAESQEKGCIPGDCSYRPQDPAEQRRIRERRSTP